MVGDAFGFAEVADDDAALAQRRRQVGAGTGGVAAEQEVGRRGQHLEVHRFQRVAQGFALFDHQFAAALEKVVVLEGGLAGGDRQPVQRVGIEAVLDPLQPVNQLRMAHREADAQAGQ